MGFRLERVAVIVQLLRRAFPEFRNCPLEGEDTVHAGARCAEVARPAIRSDRKADIVTNGIDRDRKRYRHRPFVILRSDAIQIEFPDTSGAVA